MKLLLKKIPFLVKAYHYYLRSKIKPIGSFQLHAKHHFSGARVLEIGGPSAIFRAGNLLPVYSVADSVDNCNFSSKTFWSSIEEGANFNFNKKKKTGNQFIRDGIKLQGLPDENYDVMMTSHVLEHIANPLKALHEWKRVLKPGGVMILILPHKDGAYDRLRPVTTLGHILEDFKNNTTEEDKTHFDEVIRLHDLSRDSTVKDYESHVQRTLDNTNCRIVHHHVFNAPLVAQILDHMNFEILEILTEKPFHIIAIARKLEHEDAKPQGNKAWLSGDHPNYRNSIFPSDRSGI